MLPFPAEIPVNAERTRLPGSRWWAAAGVALALVVQAAPTAAQVQGPPTFRAGVDLIAVDVQVIDRGGEPVANLGPESFSVSIDGRRRRVVSAEVVRVLERSTSLSSDRWPPSGPLATNAWPMSGPVGRTFVLAIDAGSFHADDARRAVQAARVFVQQVGPNDLVGVFAYPFGPQLSPTDDRGLVLRALDRVGGGAQSLVSHYHLTPAEVVDINVEAAFLQSRGIPTGGGRSGQSALSATSLAETETLRRVSLRECGGDTDSSCTQGIEQDAQALAAFYEGEMTQAVNGLADVLRGLATYPGKRVVVVLSAGMPVSDRLGGRPTVGDAARALGDEAARANATMYALHIDSSFLRTHSAEALTADPLPGSQERESIMMGQFLDQLAGTSGGTLMRILVGSGEQALRQILHETASYYLLGVAPADTDRDGRTHRLKVTVDAPHTTVRSRSWVHVPKARQAG